MRLHILGMQLESDETIILSRDNRSFRSQLAQNRCSFGNKYNLRLPPTTTVLITHYYKIIKYTNISLLKYCKEQDFEIVAVKLKLDFKSLIVFCVYRAPKGNLEYFLNQLDSILNALGNPKTEYIICGDLNINYIGTNNKKTNQITY